MTNIDENLIKNLIENESKPFDCEFGFQLSLAMSLKLEDNIIEFERKIYKNKKGKCDIVVTDKNGDKTFIELKYKYRENEDKSSYEARKTFIKDIYRLRNSCNEAGQKYCIFLTNKKSIYKNTESAKREVGLFNKNFANEEHWIEFSNWKDTKETIRCLIVKINDKRQENCIKGLNRCEIITKNNKQNGDNNENT